MRVLIVANGNGFSSAFFFSFYQKTDYIICADGGYRHLQELSVEPNEVLGDFDSFDREKIQCDHVKVFPAKKDRTDTELAILRAVELGADEIILLGCIGTRMDHTLANLFLLKMIQEKGIKAVALDEHNKVYYAKKSICINGKKGDTLSILPLTAVCRGVKTEGLFYPLNGEDLSQDSSRGISNVLLDKEARIFIEQGEAFVMLTMD